MQIRLTVVDPLGASAPGRESAPRSDVLVTAPAGTALAAVASALAQVVSGGDGSGTPVLYAGEQRLDAQRSTLGEPPLTDGAVLSVGAPGEPEPHPEWDDAPAQLQVVAGPDAGGVHLLHGGEIRIGRSADADVPLDDPDVSRLHCAVTVAADGRVSVADLDSTNGTTLDGARVGSWAVRFAPGALLRIGESALRLAPAGGPGGRVETTPDGEGHVRVPGPAGDDTASPAAAVRAAAPSGPTQHTYGTAAWGTPGASGPGSAAAVVPGQGGAPGIEGEGRTPGEGARPGSAGIAHASPALLPPEGSLRAPRQRGAATPVSSDTDTHAGRSGIGAFDGPTPHGTAGAAPAPGHPRPATTDASAAHRSGQPGADAGAVGGAGHPGAAAYEHEQYAGGAAGGAGRPPAGAFEDTGRARTGNPGGTGRDRAGGADGSGHGLARPAATGGPAAPHPAAESGGAGTRNHPGGAATPQGPYGSAAPADAPLPGAPADPSLSADERLGRGRKGTPLRGTDVPPGARRRGGLGAWARRWTGGRAEQPARPPRGAYDADEPPPRPRGAPGRGPGRARDLAGSGRAAADGPGARPRLWERTPGHPEALAIRLGTADRAAPDGSGLLPAVPVTAGLREVGALGLAGPRARLSGLARAVLAQLAALHSPDTLEIVLITADRSRPLEERTAEWSWLGWLPHVRPGHGQDCRLLLAHDREQAAARTEELLRRLEDQLTEEGASAGTAAGGLIPGARSAGAGDRAAGARVPQPGPRPGGAERPERPGPVASGAPGTPPPPGTGPAGPAGPAAVTGSDPAQARPATRRPSWARDEATGPAASGFPGPYTVLVVDGDPGGADLREAVARLAVEGPRAGIHVICLAETAAASPASPVSETYEAACAAAPTFRQCGAVALLSGDVATALRLLRVARTGTDGGAVGPVGHGTVGTVDAVSPAWAERFARALAPLRTDGPAGDGRPRVSAPLPQAARLLDELGLARATPASLMARWADAADDTEALGGRVRAVLGAGPRGPVSADLAAQGPHLLIEGPPGSGRTELLRAVVASLAAAERPDRLGIVLVDGRGGPGAGGGAGEGLRVCTDVPHVSTYLTAHDPVRMREFAQSLSAELKRRAELLGRSDFTEWHTGRELSGRMVAQRTATARGTQPGETATGDLDSPSSSTLRLRPGKTRPQAEAAAPPLPRLVVVVDDLDALVSPALGSTGRPAAGSVMRALEAVAREGERLGVHLVAATGPCPRTAETEPARRATLRVTLDAPAQGPDEPAPGRGSLTGADGRVTPFQGGRVTGRIPRTATLRPTVVALEWHRMGDPPARRPVRELGNGPTDLALLASALERAAREVAAARVPSLL
ncbi:FtsK/SpoIIIE domain-containing protein [Streptomyces levis]|uniref:FtsK/SpoIIIE domain-containing protein n=1 Tax=Streptomyces levis TaxID=285566 RepID=UPI003C7C5374